MPGPNFQVEPGMPEHAKVRRLGNERIPAMGLWTMCGAWAVGNSSNGFVPREIVARFSTDGCNALQLADLLVGVGLWVEKEVLGEDGYVFHDWDDRNDPLGADERRRNATRKRVQRYRERKRAADQQQQADAVTPGNALHGVTESVTVTRYGNALQPSPPASPPQTPPLLTPPTGGSVATHHGSRGATQEGVAGGEPSRKRSGGGPRGTRIPEDWKPTEADINWFRENCPHLRGRGRELTDEFRDYWLARAGKDATKIDWSKTWKNRMRDREERERNRQQDLAVRATARGGGAVGSPPRSTTDVRAEALDQFRSRPSDPDQMIIEQPQLGD